MKRNCPASRVVPQPAHSLAIALAIRKEEYIRKIDSFEQRPLGTQRVAARAGARRAVLVHISPRYTEEEMEKFVDAAKKRFANMEIGTDLQQFTIPYRCARYLFVS